MIHDFKRLFNVLNSAPYEYILPLEQPYNHTYAHTNILFYLKNRLLLVYTGFVVIYLYNRL